MSDLIDRQAAIDEIKEIYEWHDNVTKERIIEHFEQLPSAQPTGADIQKMQDIEQAMLEKAYECGKDAAKWIPCSERMPDPTSYYLISDGAGTWVSIWNGEDWMSVTGLPVTIIDVIAWMPLPEPYAERRTDD